VWCGPAFAFLSRSGASLPLFFFRETPFRNIDTSFHTHPHMDLFPPLSLRNVQHRLCPPLKKVPITLFFPNGALFPPQLERRFPPLDSIALFLPNWHPFPPPDGRRRNDADTFVSSNFASPPSLQRSVGATAPSGLSKAGVAVSAQKSPPPPLLL